MLFQLEASAHVGAQRVGSRPTHVTGRPGDAPVQGPRDVGDHSPFLAYTGCR